MGSAKAIVELLNGKILIVEEGNSTVSLSSVIKVREKSLKF